MIARFALALALLVPPAAQAPGATDGLVMYTRGDTIYVAVRDGGGERPYATGSAPALATGVPLVAYAVRVGGAWQEVVARLDQGGAPRQVTAFTDRSEEFGPDRYGAVGAAWSPGGTWLALRLMEGSTTTLAVVRPDGGGFHRFEYGHLFGSRIAWRDETSLAVGTELGTRLVRVDGTEGPLPGARPGDTPAAWLDADRLVVNGEDGVAVVANGARRPLAAQGEAWEVLASGGVLVTTETEVLDADPATGATKRLGTLPGGGQVLGATGLGGPPLVEYAAGAEPSIYRVAPAATPVAQGSGLAVTTALAAPAVVPPGGASAAPSQPAAPPGGTPGAAGNAGDRDGRVDPAAAHAAGRGTVPAALPRRVGTGPGSLLLSALATLLLMLLITFPSELFDRTLEEHYDEVRGWFHLRPARDPATTTRPRRLASFAAFAVAAAVLGTLLDPAAAFDGATARLFAGLLVGVTTVTLLFNAAQLAYHRRRGVRGVLRVLPGALVVAGACVLVTRLTGFQPGYLYGLVAGFAFAGTVSERDEGVSTFASSLWVLLVAVVAWLAWLPVDHAVGTATPSLPLGLADSTLSAIALGGLEGLVVGLVPVRGLPGHAVFRWSRRAWVAAYTLVLFVFVHVLLRSPAEESRPDLLLWAVLFVGYGFVSVAFWAWFRRRPVSSG
ncbi:MAG TPA: FGLLP motif-containing membrane protein [Mycobacteriales bacterium]|jgi:hypothetical protein|nr:FGLLP motif-containing membrane protein [Mycobacteriales bacterium]